MKLGALKTIHGLRKRLVQTGEDCPSGPRHLYKKFTITLNPRTYVWQYNDPKNDLVTFRSRKIQKNITVALALNFIK